MESTLSIVKIVSIIQVALIFFVVALAYIVRFLSYYYNQTKIKKEKEIDELLKFHFNNKQSLKTDDIKILNNDPFFTLNNISGILKNNPNNVYTKDFQQELSNKYFKIVARKYSKSSDWIKRYYASRFYLLGYDSIDRENLSHLLNDKIILVAINAAIAVVNYVDEQLINQIISIFSQARKLQQAMFSEILAKGDTKILPIVRQRISIEKDIYIKTFCYRLLRQITPDITIIPVALSDMNSESVDLKIAALEYIADTHDTNKNNIIYTATKDSHWEVRAVAAKKIGLINEKQAVLILSQLLSDSSWRVRMDAAISLKNKGGEGIKILQDQTLEKDKFTYEIAHKLLMD